MTLSKWPYHCDGIAINRHFQDGDPAADRDTTIFNGVSGPGRAPYAGVPHRMATGFERPLQDVVWRVSRRLPATCSSRMPPMTMAPPANWEAVIASPNNR